MTTPLRPQPIPDTEERRIMRSIQAQDETLEGLRRMQDENRNGAWRKAGMPVSAKAEWDYEIPAPQPIERKRP